jgi:hypothetical protein
LIDKAGGTYSYRYALTSYIGRMLVCGIIEAAKLKDAKFSQNIQKYTKP